MVRIELVLIDPVVIIHVRVVASRTRRVVVGVRLPANMNIQGGMTFRLTGPHSRLEERHEAKERKGMKGERKGQKARGAKEKNRNCSTVQPGFTSGE